jgi:hypothetical protein
LPDILSSSPSVETSRRRGEDPLFFPVSPGAPNKSVDVSITLVMRLPAVRSHHSLPTIPLSAGEAPLRKVE